MIEFICDISNLQKELEIRLKEIMELNLKTEKQEKEIYHLKDINLENNLKREKIVESLQKGLIDLENTKELVISLEQEKSKLNSQLKDANLKNQNFLVENLSLTDNEKRSKKKIENLEIYLKEKETTIIELNKLVDQQNLLENKLSEYKEKFIYKNEEFEELYNQKNLLEKNLYSANLKIENLEINLKEKELNAHHFEDKFNLNKNLYEEELLKHQKNKLISEEKEIKLNRELNSSNEKIQENKRNLDQLSFQIIEVEKKNEESKKSNDFLIAENSKIRAEAITLNSEILKLKEICGNFEIIKNENNSLREDVKKFLEKNVDFNKTKTENLFLEKENNRLNERIKEFMKNEEIAYNEFNILHDDYSILKKNFDEANCTIDEGKNYIKNLEKNFENYKYEKEREIKEIEKEILILGNEKNKILEELSKENYLYNNEKERMIIDFEKEFEKFNFEKEKLISLVDKEKKEKMGKDLTIKKLENEILQNSSIINNFNKISNLSFVNLKMSFKNLLNSLDNYNVNFSTLKNKIYFTNLNLDIENKNNNNNNLGAISGGNINNNNNFSNGNFNFRRYVSSSKDKDKEKDIKKTERTEIGKIKKNSDVEKETRYEELNTLLENNIKDLFKSIEAFSDWVNIIKNEINVNLKYIFNLFNILI
jgi:hypothetical protein